MEYENPMALVVYFVSGNCIELKDVPVSATVANLKEHISAKFGHPMDSMLLITNDGMALENSNALFLYFPLGKQEDTQVYALDANDPASLLVVSQSHASPDAKHESLELDALDSLRVQRQLWEAFVAYIGRALTDLKEHSNNFDTVLMTMSLASDPKVSQYIMKLARTKLHPAIGDDQRQTLLDCVDGDKKLVLFKKGYDELHKKREELLSRISAVVTKFEHMRHMTPPDTNVLEDVMKKLHPSITDQVADLIATLKSYMNNFLNACMPDLCSAHHLVSIIRSQLVELQEHTVELRRLHPSFDHLKNIDRLYQVTLDEVFDRHTYSTKVSRAVTQFKKKCELLRKAELDRRKRFIETHGQKQLESMMTFASEKPAEVEVKWDSPLIDFNIETSFFELMDSRAEDDILMDCELKRMISVEKGLQGQVADLTAKLSVNQKENDLLREEIKKLQQKCRQPAPTTQAPTPPKPSLPTDNAHPLAVNLFQHQQQQAANNPYYSNDMLHYQCKIENQRLCDQLNAMQNDKNRLEQQHLSFTSRIRELEICISQMHTYDKSGFDSLRNSYVQDSLVSDSFTVLIEQLKPKN